VSSSSGLARGASKGIIAALRLADDIPASGQGFRLLPFTAALSSGAGGGPLVDSQGALLGIITKRIARGLGGASAEARFAVPIETVIGLADGRGKRALGSGAALPMPASRPSPSTAAVVASRAQDILRVARTLHMAWRARLRPLMVAARGCTAIPGTQTYKAMSAPPAGPRYAAPTVGLARMGRCPATVLIPL
jgi:hypothetical protein